MPSPLVPAGMLCGNDIFPDQEHLSPFSNTPGTQPHEWPRLEVGVRVITVSADYTCDELRRPDEGYRHDADHRQQRDLP